MRRLILRPILIVTLAAGVALGLIVSPVPSHASLLQAGAPLAPGDLKLPLKDGSVRFALIGDNGTGAKEQYEVAAQMNRYHDKFPYDFVLMLGDNLYGGSSPSDYKKKFEVPYQALLSGGVKFFASLGNHDNTNERFYAPFNMGGQRFYTYKKGNAEFFALDSNYMDPEEMNWIEQKMGTPGNGWKIAYFHHPLYSDGKFHGPDLDLRQRLEPLLMKHGVNVVFNGHEHVYERIAPQNGIYYFVMGCSGELRPHNLQPSKQMQKGFDTDRAFMLVEISGDDLFFQTISRTGATIDSGTIARQKK